MSSTIPPRRETRTPPGRRDRPTRRPRVMRATASSTGTEATNGQARQIITSPIALHELENVRLGDKQLKVKVRVEKGNEDKAHVQGVRMLLQGEHLADINPHEEHQIHVQDQDHVDDRLPLHFAVDLHPEHSIGDHFDIHIEPELDGEPLVGYTKRIQIAHPRDVLIDTLDRALGAFHDYHHVTNDPLAKMLFDLHLEKYREESDDIDGFVDWLDANEPLFTEFVEHLHEVDHGNEVGVRDVMEDFLDALDTSPSDNEILLLYGDMTGRLQFLTPKLIGRVIAKPRPEPLPTSPPEPPAAETPTPKPTEADGCVPTLVRIINSFINR